MPALIALSVNSGFDRSSTSAILLKFINWYQLKMHAGGYFLPNLVVANSHPPNSSPLIQHSNHLVRVKAITWFLWGKWSQLTTTFQTTSLGQNNTLRGTCSPSPSYAWAHGHPRLASVIYDWQGRESMANVALLGSYSCPGYFPKNLVSFSQNLNQPVASFKPPQPWPGSC